MIRLFVESRLYAGAAVVPDEKQIHYLKNVMRCDVGEQVLLFNGQDGEWAAVVSQFDKKRFMFAVGYRTRAQTALPVTVLCPALIKKEPMDLVLQKATELGVTRIQPLITRHTVVRQFNLERARLIVREAAEQCERLCVPRVDAPITTDDFLKTVASDETLIFLTERGQTNGSCFTPEKACFVIGPEGGWTPDEIKRFAAVKNGVFCHLGQTILRAETAALAALACRAFLLTDKK